MSQIYAIFFAEFLQIRAIFLMKFLQICIIFFEEFLQIRVIFSFGMSGLIVDVIVIWPGFWWGM